MRTILVVVILIIALSASALAIPYEIAVYEMHRTASGWPPNPIELKAQRNVESVAFQPCIAHHHNCGNGLSFSLWLNNASVYSASWSNCLVSQCGPFVTYDVSLNNTLADNITWGGYIGTQSWGFNEIEFRVKPVILRGTIARDSELVDFGSAEEITNPAPGSNAFRIITPSANLLAWIGGEEDYSSTLSTDRESRVYACADTNNNKICDVNEASFRSCDTAGGDFYRGYCCGVNYTSCQYVGKIPIPYTEQVCTGYRFWGGCTHYSTITRYNNITINAICGNNSQGQWEWVPADEAGEIREMSCPNSSVVANGSSIFSCGNQMEGATVPLGGFERISIGSVSHEYSCKDREVYECGGITGPFSTLNGVEMGATNPSFTNETFYCASDGDWTTDLDTKDNESCEAAGFSWTGSRCCSEADDPAEYYNDPKYPNATGGCWNKMFVRSGDYSVTDRILNYNGKFFGCRLRLINDAILLNLQDYHLNNLLIDNSITPCGMVLMDAQPGGMPHAKCQPNGEWMFTDEPGGVINKSIKWAGLVSSGIALSGCCAADQCWNGTKCQKLGTYYRIGEEGFICKMLPPSSTPEPPTSEICHHNNDCPTGQYCTDQECVSGPLPDTCANNNACPSGYNCQQHACVEEPV